MDTHARAERVPSADELHLRDEHGGAQAAGPPDVQGLAAVSTPESSGPMSAQLWEFFAQTLLALAARCAWLLDPAVACFVGTASNNVTLESTNSTEHSGFDDTLITVEAGGTDETAASVTPATTFASIVPIAATSSTSAAAAQATTTPTARRARRTRRTRRDRGAIEIDIATTYPGLTTQQHVELTVFVAETRARRLANPRPPPIPYRSRVDVACGCGDCPDGIAGDSECASMTFRQTMQRLGRRATESVVGDFSNQYNSCRTPATFARPQI